MYNITHTTKLQKILVFKLVRSSRFNAHIGFKPTFALLALGNHLGVSCNWPHAAHVKAAGHASYLLAPSIREAPGFAPLRYQWCLVYPRPLPLILSLHDGLTILRYG